MNVKDKSESNIRVLYLNIANISFNQTIKMGELIANAEKFEVDILLLQEHNLNFRMSPVFQEISKMVKHFWNYYAFIPSNTPDLCVSANQPGGTMIVLNRRMCQRVKAKGTDPLGRWSWMSICGRKQHQTILVSVYAISHSSNPGPLTYESQLNRLKGDNDVKLTPVACLWRDLKQFLVDKQDRDVTIILGIDSNTDLDNLQSPMYKIAMELGLIDVRPLSNNSDGKCSTFRDGSRRIDSIFVSEKVLRQVRNPQYLGFHDMIFSDHRGAIIDLTLATFQETEHTGFDIPRRNLSMHYPQKAEKCLVQLTKGLDNISAFERMKEMTSAFEKDGATSGNKAKFERLDRAICHQQLRAERRCRNATTKAPWSPAFFHVIKALQLVTRCVRYVKSGTVSQSLCNEASKWRIDAAAPKSELVSKMRKLQREGKMCVRPRYCGNPSYAKGHNFMPAVI